MKRLCCVFMVLILVLGLFNIAMAQSISVIEEYEKFVVSGAYDKYISNPDGNINVLLVERDREEDRFAYFDIDGNGIEELIVRTAYPADQADVFSYSRNGGVQWCARMGGDYEINDFFYIIDEPEFGFFVTTGGPAVKIHQCTAKKDGWGFVNQVVAETKIDWDTLKIIDITMYVKNEALYKKIYERFVRHWKSGLVFFDTWYSLNNLKTGDYSLPEPEPTYSIFHHG